MTNEAAVLLRASLFGLVAAVIFWSVSYAPLGTAGFLLLGGSGYAGLYLLRHQPRRPEHLRGWLRLLAGVPPPDPLARPTVWLRVGLLLYPGGDGRTHGDPVGPGPPAQRSCPPRPGDGVVRLAGRLVLRPARGVAATGPGGRLS